jgi:hypothetical protein
MRSVSGVLGRQCCIEPLEIIHQNQQRMLVDRCGKNAKPASAGSERPPIGQPNSARRTFSASRLNSPRTHATATRDR